MTTNTHIVESDCHLLRGELTDYMEGSLSPETRVRFEDHLKSCNQCTAVYDGVLNLVHLLGDGNALEVPPCFSERLRQRLFLVDFAQILTC